MNLLKKYLVWSAASLGTFFSGSLLNIVAVIINGGKMPVYFSGAGFCDSAYVLDDVHACMTINTHLKALCDFIPIGGAIASIGDVVLGAGFISFSICIISLAYAVVKYQLMRTRKKD